jgi:cytochrome c
MDIAPLPHDLPLQLPASIPALELAIVLLFLAHILFVNLMLGGAVLGLVYEIRGRTRPALDRVAREIAATVTVNKSLAVVLGVGPLLVMNVLYTLYFYSANALTGSAWILIVPAVAVAFLLLYAHKYSWDALADHKALHLGLGGAGTAILMAVPLIFLTNINLMLFPERWQAVRGFLTALVLPNVLPRYLHFLLASLAITGLFLAAVFGRRRFDADKRLPGVDQVALRRELLLVALAATCLQVVAGPLLLFTLPPHGMSWPLLFDLTGGVTLAIVAMLLLWREIRIEKAHATLNFWAAVIVLGCTVGLMGTARHLYREGAITPHRERVAANTAVFQAESLGARMRLAAGTPRLDQVEVVMSAGERTFRTVCNACHDLRTRRVGPPVTEIVQIYADNPEGLAAWVRAPGRKRPDYPEMPPIALQDSQYREVARFLLDEALVDPKEDSTDRAGASDTAS